MKREDYLKTAEGQKLEKSKRFLDKQFIVVNQEPKSKNSSDSEKKFFREEVSRYLLGRKRKAYTGSIALQIDFYTTKNNPPALQALVKNYLDLLHKKMPDVDDKERILFKDDRQVKILIANYHLDILNKQTPKIIIRAYRYSHFIKDVTLASQIFSGYYGSESSFCSWDYKNETEFKVSDYDLDELFDLIRERERKIEEYGKLSYTSIYYNLLRKAQEGYLKQNEFGIEDLKRIFRIKFPEIYVSEDCFECDSLLQKILQDSFLYAKFLDLGDAPFKSGDKTILRDNIKNRLDGFIRKNNILLPILHPIRITIILIPPKYNEPDLDNLAKDIIPTLIDILKPPSRNIFYLNDENDLQDFKTEKRFSQKIPANCVTSYQMISLPRQIDDPAEGNITLSITEGFSLKGNIWNLVDDVIDKWQDSI